MSQLKAISLAILLFVSTVGITVDKHYCHGSLIGTWLYVQDDACGTDMPMKCGTCHDDITVYSIQSEFQSTPVDFSLSAKLTSLVPAFVVEFRQIVENKPQTLFSWLADLSPPATSKVFIRVKSLLL